MSISKIARVRAGGKRAFIVFDITAESTVQARGIRGVSCKTQKLSKTRRSEPRLWERVIERRTSARARFSCFTMTYLKSAAFRSLNCTARSLLFELFSHYKPDSETVYLLSVRRASKRLGVHPDTPTKAFLFFVTGVLLVSQSCALAATH